VHGSCVDIDEGGGGGGVGVEDFGWRWCTLLWCEAALVQEPCVYTYG
jgi:hypothetical protein